MAEWLRALTREGRIERQAARFATELIENPEQVRDKLARWLAGDPARRVMLETMLTEVDRSMGAARTIPLPVLPEVARHGRSRGQLILLATCLLAAVAAAAFLMGLKSFDPSASHPPGSSVAGQRLITAREIRSFPLADGSTVTLDAGSAVSVMFGRTKRALTLDRGRARFEVAHDAARPFMVHAGAGTITAHGTIFDVWIRPDRQIRVNLVRGAIDVRLPNRSPTPALRHQVQLAPGQRVEYGAESAVHHATLSALRTAAASETRWMDDMIDFDDVPLGDVVLEANAHSDIPIVLEGDRLAATKIFASLTIRDTRALARKIALLLDLEMIEEPGRIVLRSGQKKIRDR